MGAVGMNVIGRDNWGKAIPVNPIKAAITNTLGMAALGVQTDFDVVTQTWTDKPTITLVKKGEYSILVVVAGKVFKFVNEGTSAHMIYPSGRFLRFQRNYRAKTKPNGRIASYSGGKSGPFVFARKVRHPGTSGRHFDKIIRRKWEKQFPVQMQRAINAAVRANRMRA